MKHILVAYKWRIGFFAMASMLFSMPAFPTTITFNEAGLVSGFGPQELGMLPKGTALSNQLSGMGATFSSSGAFNYVANSTTIPGVPTSGNFLVILNNVILGPAPWGYVDVAFGASGASNISLDVFDSNADSPRVVVRAYDANNTLLSAPLNLNAFTASMSIAFAHHIRIEDTGGDGLVIDNLTFTPAAEGVPEPGTWLLLGGGLAVIGSIRLRKRKAVS